MASKAVTEKRDDQPQPPSSGYQPAREVAPSVLREDEPQMARMAGMWGLMFLVLGSAVITLTMSGVHGLLGYGWGSVCIALGLCGLLMHAVLDKDMQVRRAYGVFGAALLVIGAVVPWLPQKGEVGPYFVYGLPCLILAVLFLLTFIHHETEPLWRERAINALGIVGAALAVVGFLGGNIKDSFLLPRGLLLAVVGLIYLCAFVGTRGVDHPHGYRAALGMGVAGAVVALIALGRSILPPIFYSWGWTQEQPAPYFVPAGFLLLVVGLCYGASAALLSSDSRLVVLTRRELSAYFYSPLFYLVFGGMTLLAWGYFALVFLNEVERNPLSPKAPVFEPIVRNYFGFIPLLSLVFLVPILTMRLLSEEKRTGSLEVLLTAPVKESTIVLSKFLASLVFFLLAWLPFFLFLVGLRMIGGKDFDYRPILSFLVALTFMGAGFMAMGLFFSSLSGNQMVSAVFSGAMMMGGIVLYLAMQYMIPRSVETTQQSPWLMVLRQINYVDLWFDSLGGALVPKYLLFHLTFAIFFIFITVKVLEARRWS